MPKPKITKKGVLILEFSAIITAITLAGFLGFSYVNEQQKLASSGSSKTASSLSSNQADHINGAEISSVRTTTELAAAQADLDAVQQIIDQTDNQDALLRDLDSIAN